MFEPQHNHEHSGHVEGCLKCKLNKAAPGLMKAIFDCRKAFAAGATVVEIMVILDDAVKEADNESV